MEGWAGRPTGESAAAKGRLLGGTGQPGMDLLDASASVSRVSETSLATGQRYGFNSVSFGSP